MTLGPSAAALFAATLLGIPAPAQSRLPATPESVRLRADAALAAGNLTDALQAYEDLTGRLKTPTPDLLRAIATNRSAGLTGDADLRVRVAACSAVLMAGPHPGCSKELKRLAEDQGTEPGTRLAAAAALVERKAPGAVQLFGTVVGMTFAAAPAVTADALARMPAAVSHDALKRLAVSDNRDARYIATMALARRRAPDAVPILRATAEDKDAGAARLAAYIGLAALGETDGLRVVRETLPLIQGRERLEAALALALNKDADATRLIAELAQGDHDLLRIEAAESLYVQRRDLRELAERVISEGVVSSNPFVRVRAIEAAATTGMASTPALRRGLLDRNPLVALAVSRAVLAAPERQP